MPNHAEGPAPWPSARAALALLFDEFTELDTGAVSRDPLHWPEYRASLDRARARSGLDESVIVAQARVGDRGAVAAAFDFGFMGGSMGEATGRRLVMAMRTARERGLPFVSVIATGGARMQEGMRSLVQMQDVAREIAANRGRGVPHISVLGDPTTGGVWVSLASTADVILARRGARVSFAGARARGADNGDGDLDSYSAEGQARNGHVDLILADEELPGALRRYVRLVSDIGAPTPVALPIRRIPAACDEDAWKLIEATRSPDRHGAAWYLDRWLADRMPICGDRAGGVDPGMLCGIGTCRGQSVAFVAQTGTANTPAGFRTAKRLVEFADRLAMPILTLIDTPGAANDSAAEAGGIGSAIGELMIAVSSARVPITAILIGEGGSGGALALARRGRLWATERSYFAVISPESAAAILHRRGLSPEEVSELLGLTPGRLRDLEVVEGVVEPAD